MTRWPTEPPSAPHFASFADAEPRSYWHATSPIDDPRPSIQGQEQADLCIVGGGFTGLWAALAAKERDPGRDVALLEADRAGEGASGRNGGFYSLSLTHGLDNGLRRFGDEMPALERLGMENLAGLRADIERLGIECELEEVGAMGVAVEPHEVEELAAGAKALAAFGHEIELLDSPAAVQREVRSPTYLAGLWDRSGNGLLDPGKLIAGLRRAALAAGARIYEHSHVQSLEHRSGKVAVACDRGTLQARRVLLATSAYPSPLKRVRRYIVPVYDYILLTEPLSQAQLAAIGWQNRQGLNDLGNQFHYYRRVGNDRILWGGYDAIYRFRGPVRADLDDYRPTFARLAQHFFHTFPQLEGLRFSHRWGGAIDTCSRFSPFFGRAFGGRVAYVTGYTGLGVAASRFGAHVALDVLDGRDSEATRLRFVNTKPVAFPPEPVRTAVVQLTRSRLAAADRKRGRRGLWLRTLDRLGLGFDS